MSAKTIAEKPHIKPGSIVWISDDAHAELIGTLPIGASATGDSSGATVAVLFVGDSPRSPLQRLV